MKSHEDHQVIPDSVITNLCESLINNLGSKPQPRGFIRSEYMILIRSVPAVDDAVAEAYAEASLMNDIDGTPIPDYLAEAHLGHGLTQVNSGALSILKAQALKVYGRPLDLGVMTASLAALGEHGGTAGIITGVDYGAVVAVIHVYHRETTVGDNLLVVEVIRKGGAADPRAPASNRYTIRQCNPMEGTASTRVDQDGTTKETWLHMIIPEDWYPLAQGTKVYQWGHHEIERALPGTEAWGHPQPTTRGLR